jgi:glucose-6-phosphate 1-dehydrogenase
MAGYTSYGAGVHFPQEFAMSTESLLLVNPLREGLRLQRIPEPCTMVIFGATGDLTHRKLVPALFNLARNGLLSPQFSVVGYARSEETTESFREGLRTSLGDSLSLGSTENEVWESFARGISYQRGSYDDPNDFRRLADDLDRIDEERGCCGNRVFYLATPPSSFEKIIENIGRVGLNQPSRLHPGWVRLIIEKPFGRDLASARALNRQLLSVFDEEQVYRIDHYLGKETVQNILVMRFANGIFEPIWNRQFVDHVQITVSEEIGVEGRGRYYEESGALRDMVQNHLLQLMTLVAMEPPNTFDATAVRNEKVKVLNAVGPIPPDDIGLFTVRGQYGPGSVLGEPVPGYREEPGTDPDSPTETYVALKLDIDNWRWAGVPFYLRTGKRLPKRLSEVAIQFKRPPHLLFSRSTIDGLEPNTLVLNIQPDEGISLKIGSKVPGPTIDIRSVDMEFLYGTTFGVSSPDAYERLLLDCMLGDSTLFTRRDEVEAAWTIVTSILDGWKVEPLPQMPNYAAGTWGPADANTMLARDGRRWRRL